MIFNISLGELIQICIIVFAAGGAYMRVIAKLKKLEQKITTATLGNQIYLERELSKQDIRLTHIENVIKKHSKKLMIDTSKEDREREKELDRVVQEFKIKREKLQNGGKG